MCLFFPEKGPFVDIKKFLHPFKGAPVKHPIIFTPIRFFLLNILEYLGINLDQYEPYWTSLFVVSRGAGKVSVLLYKVRHFVKKKDYLKLFRPGSS